MCGDLEEKLGNGRYEERIVALEIRRIGNGTVERSKWAAHRELNT